MKKGKSSASAARVAFVRAVESRRPPEVRICHDPLADSFITGGMRLMLSETARKIFRTIRPNPVRSGILGYVPLRTRFIDDRLQACIKDGMEQLVVLGAGFDSRAHRFDELKNGVKTFEVDHPSTQKTKLAHLTKLFGSVPGHVTHVPVDFETESLEDKLSCAGYSQSLKTLFIWEGVTYYLDPQAIDETLAFVAKKSKPGSSILFDYLPYDVTTEKSGIPLAQEFSDYVENIGEPCKFGVESERFDQFLANRGFSALENVSVEQCRQWYHSDADKDTPVLSIFRIAHAAVSP
jgi:methyltransferase (TIGR00027 family)